MSLCHHETHSRHTEPQTTYGLFICLFVCFNSNTKITRLYFRKKSKIISYIWVKGEIVELQKDLRHRILYRQEAPRMV